MNIKDQLAMQKLYASGAFAKPEPASTVPQRNDIADMDKAEVIEWLEAHGEKADKRKGVETLRAELAALMFVEA